MDHINTFDLFDDLVCVTPTENQKSAPLPSPNLTTYNRIPSTSLTSAINTRFADECDNSVRKLVHDVVKKRDCRKGIGNMVDTERTKMDVNPTSEKKQDKLGPTKNSRVIEFGIPFGFATPLPINAAESFLSTSKLPPDPAHSDEKKCVIKTQCVSGVVFTRPNCQSSLESANSSKFDPIPHDEDFRPNVFSARETETEAHPNISVQIAKKNTNEFYLHRSHSGAGSNVVASEGDPKGWLKGPIADEGTCRIEKNEPPSITVGSTVSNKGKASTHVDPNEATAANADYLKCLPSDGKVYNTRIEHAALGVMFFTPEELADSLFAEADMDFLSSLGKRPVVGFMFNSSVAHNVGVKLGHVLLTVDGIEVKTPSEARKAVFRGPRPLSLKFYIPNTAVASAEGIYMVKYDERTKITPGSITEWKAKYVVIGGIIAEPWHINMYRSRAEYEIAVIETLEQRPITVKVKHFVLYNRAFINRGSNKTFLHRDSIKTIKYPESSELWHFIVVKNPGNFPIKIASTSMQDLKPVHEAICRVLAARAEQTE